MGMSSGHLFYIPATILAGVAVGYQVGRRLLQIELEEQRRKAARRAERNAPPRGTEGSPGGASDADGAQKE